MVNILICIVIGILMVAAIFYIVRTKINAKKMALLDVLAVLLAVAEKAAAIVPKNNLWKRIKTMPEIA